MSCTHNPSVLQISPQSVSVALIYLFTRRTCRSDLSIKSLCHNIDLGLDDPHPSQGGFRCFVKTSKDIHPDRAP